MPHSAQVQPLRITSSKPIVLSTAAAPPPAQLSGPAINLTVNFARGPAELTPDAMQTLDDLGKALSSQDLAAYKFRIEVDTDTVGSGDYHRALSERRAEAVVGGVGEDRPLVPTTEPRNRRVLVINLGA